MVKILIAIVLGIGASFFFPLWANRIFVTFNSLFGNFLNFIIPLLILGLVAPGIADLGRGAGRLLLITALLAYGFTIFSGYFSYFSCNWAYPLFLVPDSSGLMQSMKMSDAITPFFTVDMPPVMGVMSALVLAFVLGLTLAVIKGNTLRNMMVDFRDVIMLVITNVIIPLLPVYIFGIFLKIGAEGSVSSVIMLFLKVVLFIFLLHILLLVIQFCIAGVVTGKNPFKSLKTMLPAYFTALGTQSSAATIPVTLAQAKKNGVGDRVADFVIPLCATIHLSGSTLKIVACAYAISFMYGYPCDVALYSEFILLLGITMVAAPGVPGGAIMAALGVIASILGFNADLQAVMVALYITMDSFGTACNVTGDGALALIIDRINGKSSRRDLVI